MSIRLRLSKAEAIAVLLAVLALVLLCVGGCTAVPTQGITPGQVEAGAYLGTVVALEATDASTEDAEAFRGAAVVLRGAIAGGEDDPDPKVLSEGWYAELLAAFGVDAPLVVYGVGVFGGVLDDVVVIEGADRAVPRCGRRRDDPRGRRLSSRAPGGPGRTYAEPRGGPHGARLARFGAAAAGAVTEPHTPGRRGGFGIPRTTLVRRPGLSPQPVVGLVPHPARRPASNRIGDPMQTAARLVLAALMLLPLAACTTPTTSAPPLAFSAPSGFDGFDFSTSWFVTGMGPNGQVQFSPAAVADERDTAQPAIDVIRDNYHLAGWGTQVTGQQILVETEPDPTVESQGSYVWQTNSAGQVTLFITWDKPREDDGGLGGPWFGRVGMQGIGNSRSVICEPGLAGLPDTGFADVNGTFDDFYRILTVGGPGAIIDAYGLRPG